MIADGSDPFRLGGLKYLDGVLGVREPFNQIHRISATRPGKSLQLEALRHLATINEFPAPSKADMLSEECARQPKGVLRPFPDFRAPPTRSINTATLVYSPCTSVFISLTSA